MRLKKLSHVLGKNVFVVLFVCFVSFSCETGPVYMEKTFPS